MRISLIDNAKAIGIILVMLGHTEKLPPLFKSLIYSFHMPLFFFLAGLLLKEKYLSGTFRSFVFKNIKSLVIPYASFWVISYLYWLATYSIRVKMKECVGFSLYDPFIGLFYGTCGKLYINGILWFFTCLFCTAILFYWVSKLKEKKFILPALLALGLIGKLIHEYINIRLPWNLDLSLIAIGFYGLGYIVSRLDTYPVKKFFKLRYFALGLLSYVLFLTAKTNGIVGMGNMHFGNFVLFYIGSFSGIAITVMLSQLIKYNIVSEWLSRNTIILFPFHKMILNAFIGLGVLIFGLSQNFSENFMIRVLFIIGVVTICLPVSYFLNKYCSWIIGCRSTFPKKMHTQLEVSKKKIEFV